MKIILTTNVGNMQQIDRRIFKNGMLDSDSGSIYLPENSWVNMHDFRIGAIDSVNGRIDFVQSVGSTVLKANNALPATGVNLCIGHAPDIPYKRMVFFNWNSLGNHCIFCYDLPSDTVFTVLLNNQVNGGLNFDKYHPIHSCYVMNHCVYWTDNLNQPKRINIDAGIKLNQPSYVTTFLPYTAPMDLSVTYMIRRQPGIPPTCLKNFQSVPALTNNFIADQAFQFCYRYIYRDFETGTQSGFSNLAPFSISGDNTTNCIDITIPLQEKIIQDVIQIDLICKYMISGIEYIIQSWFSTTDAAAISAHNAGTQALTYRFYNNKIGIAIDSAYANKQYDTVPLYVQTMEAAKNRGFLMNYTAGYDTPSGAANSLALTLVSQSQSNVVTGEWFLFKYQSGSPPSGASPFTRTLYLLNINNLAIVDNPGYYTVAVLAPPFPGTVAFAICTFVGGSLFQVMDHFDPGRINTILQYTDQSASSTVTGAPTPPALIGQRAFKSDAAYQYAITYYDYWGRKCGVVTNPSMQIQIPDRNYSSVAYFTYVQWALSNAAALTEIPDWAYYYSVDLTLCLRTRFFLQARSPQIVYATKDASNSWLFTSTTYSSTNAGVAVDISLLTSQGMGYIWTPGGGDILKLWTSDGLEYKMAIIAQVNQYLICQLQNVVNLATGTKPLFEIYTPYQPQSDEPEYEINQIFPISSPGTAGRMYSNITGKIYGDVTLLNRNDGTSGYLTENMSPNDKYYFDWFTDAGRPNFTDTIGQQTKVATITWSSTFINGSKINGLSTFDALSTRDISPDYGSIMKLVHTNKIKMTGSVMLAIGNSGETASLYMSENVITTTTGETQLVQTSDVIGYVNNLRGSYGTINPESVVEFRGNVYWYDALNGRYIQYSDSGLFAISHYKLSRFWNLFTNQYISMTPQQIEALGSRPYIFSGIDPGNGELLVSVPCVLATPPLGFLVDYPTIPYPGDFWDGQAKTVAYKITAEPNKWIGSYRIPAEQYGYLENDCYSWNNGQMYLHNSPTSYGNFYGVQQIPDICFYSNANPNRPKECNNLALQANAAPIFTHLASDYPTTQSSTVAIYGQPPQSWAQTEGVWYSRILRDRLTPKLSGTYDDMMYKGDKMRSVALQVYMQFDTSGGIVQVKFCNVNYDLSKGHVMA